MPPAFHHLELWIADLASSKPSFDWLLCTLGWRATLVEGWDTGCIWTAPSGEYLVLEQSAAVAGTLNRLHAGMNHLALKVDQRELLDQIRAEASQHGWRELFSDLYPHAGGPDSVALYLENGEGFEVELVAQ